MNRLISILALIAFSGCLLFPADTSAQQGGKKFGNRPQAGQGWKNRSGAGNQEWKQKWQNKRQQNGENSSQQREQMRKKWQERKGQQGGNLTEEQQQKRQQWKEKWGQQNPEKMQQWKEKWGAQNADKMAEMKEKWSQLRQNNPELSGLQERMKAMKEAWASGDQEAFKAKMQEFRNKFQGLSPEARANMQQQVPELAQQFERFQGGTQAQGNFAGNNFQMQNKNRFDGKTLTQEGTFSGPRGGQTNRTAQYTKEGNTVKQTGQLETDKGKKFNVEGTHSKDGNAINTNKTWTSESGKQLNLDRQSVKEGNTTTSTGNWSSDKGQGATVVTTSSKEGNTINKNVEITTQDGKSYNAAGVKNFEKGHSSTQWETDQGQTFESSSDWLFDVLDD